MASTTTLKRFGKQSYEARLVAKGSPPWSGPALLLRFSEKNGTDTMFVITGEACKSFETCQKETIYSMEVSGKCVRLCNSMTKYGFPNTQEVHLKFPCVVQVAKSAWPSSSLYRCEPWEALQQKTSGSFVDLVGRALGKPVPDPTSPIPKAVVLVGNGHFTQSVELLGSDASLTLN